jgi:hypothetical protein
VVAPSDHLTGLTQARLKELLRYDPDTGVFTWLVRRPNGVKVGDPAGAVHKGSGYLRIKIDGRPYAAGRLAWLYMTGKWPIELIDHKDTDRTNNKWLNLRPATFVQNIRNRKTTAQSELKGAYLKSDHFRRAKPWATCIRVDGALKHLGTFAKPEEANAAYAKAAETFFGAFARS